jgi:hypothetical protein
MIKLRNLIESGEYNRLPTELKKHFLEIISTFGAFRESIIRKSDIRTTAETLGAIADAATEYTLHEGGDWFDGITVKRNMKELNTLVDKFQKEAKIAKAQEQRLEALYEDMGNILQRYYEIADIPQEVMKERLGLMEGKWTKIMKGVKGGAQNPPWVLVIVDPILKKVKHQQLVKVRDAIPAHYEDLKKKFGGYVLSIEDSTGQIVYNEKL